MGIAPNDSLDHTNPPSYCARPGPSRLPSPNPFHAAAPSPASDTEDTASLLALTSTAASASTSTSRSSSPFLSAHSTFIASTPHPSFETDTAVEDENGRIGRHAKRPCLHPTCERVLTSPDMRQVHMGIHKTKVRKAFLCTLGCGEVFTRRHDRQRHEVALHGKKCQYVCARCKRFFSNARMLDRHVCRGQRQGSIQWPLGGMFKLSRFSLCEVADALFFEDDEVPDASSAPEGNSP
ncbi:hypothetical protein C8R44DRAFT_627929 [Mycena epipterygia]|nr:hypothetical protein C8R44DRAFT_627929 [Mycena epipterygia]